MEASPLRVVAAEESSPCGQGSPITPPQASRHQGQALSQRESAKPPRPQHPLCSAFCPSLPASHSFLMLVLSGLDGWGYQWWGHYRTRPPEGQNGGGPAVSWNPSEAKPSPGSRQEGEGG